MKKTELILGVDQYNILLEALRDYVKSDKVDVTNFDTVRELYGHIVEQYSSSLPKEVRSIISNRLNWEESSRTPHKFVGGQDDITWRCKTCGKSRVHSVHKNALGAYLRS